MRFLLALHDVWPGNFPLAADYLARLRAWGARRIALLVVPAYHGAPPLDQSPAFLAWLREEHGRGTDLFLHGYHHWMGELALGEAFAARRSAWGRLVNRSAGREAEFAGLPRADRARILAAGLAAWRRAGLPLAGFVAPTWHGAPEAARMRAEGIALWETRFRLHHLPTGRARFVPPLAWAKAGAGGEARLFGGEAWLRALLNLPLMKVALHPGDLDGRRAGAVLERVFAAGENVAYGEIFGSETRAAEGVALKAPIP
jgi:predicted deacetylase